MQVNQVDLEQERADWNRKILAALDEAIALVNSWSKSDEANGREHYAGIEFLLDLLAREERNLRGIAKHGTIPNFYSPRRKIETEEEKRRRIEKTLAALDAIAEIGDPEEHRETFEKLKNALDAGRPPEQKYFR